MKKILFVTEYFYPRLAGGEIWSYELCRMLASLPDYEVTVITSKVKGYPDRTNINKIEIYRICETGRFFKRLNFSNNLYKFLKEHLKNNKYDIIHSMAYIPIIPVNLSTKNLSCKKILSIHLYLGNLWYKVTNLLNALINFMLENILLLIDKSDVIHVPSEYIRDKIQIKENMKVVHNFINIDEINKSVENIDILKIKNKLNIQQHNYMIVCVGSLQKIKQFDKLINDIKIWNNIKLVIIGEGEERNNLIKIINKKNLKNNVILLGEKSHKETLQIMKCSDLFINYSLTESFSYVLYEAFILGKKIITTPVGIAKELKKINNEQLDIINKYKDVNILIKLYYPLLETHTVDYKNNINDNKKCYITKFIECIYR